jgi:salicylate hydroxylase
MGGAAPRFSGCVAWRATAPLGGRRETGIWLGPNAHLVTYPLDRSDTLNLVAVTKGAARGEGWASPGRRDELMRAFADWAPPVQTMLISAEAWATWPLYEAETPTFGEGPVTLIGDAAHPILPHMAQGAAMAIEDAAVLAGRLDETPDDPDYAFRKYETERAERVAAVQNAARRNGIIFRLGGPAAFARDTALRFLGAERLMARFDWLYGYRAH